MQFKGLIGKNSQIFKDTNDIYAEGLQIQSERGGTLLYRKDSLINIMKNNSSKYHEGGMREVIQEFKKNSIKCQYLVNKKL